MSSGIVDTFDTALNFDTPSSSKTVWGIALTLYCFSGVDGLSTLPNEPPFHYLGFLVPVCAGLFHHKKKKNMAWVAPNTFQRGNVFASRNMADATRSSLRLYRRALKAAPVMVRTYRLPYSVNEIRRAIRYDFESHSRVTDPAIVDLLVMKGENNLEEVEQNWATKAHVLHYMIEIESKMQEAQRASITDEGAKVIAEFCEPGADSIHNFNRFA
jgi:NADH dehydrogenase (ubiquinone) 1 alpha subcomplex subunit 6